MKRAWWGLLVAVSVILSPFSAAALDTIPSDPNAVKVNGPLLITGYSFSGHSLRYVQLFNASSNVVPLSDWRVSLEHAVTQQVYATLNGSVAPGKYVTVANTNFVPSATFTFADVTVAADPIPTTISLLPPASTNYNAETATPTVTTSTLRVAGTPATFYFARNLSTTTGNYLSTFTAFVPGSAFNLISDGLYVAPVSPQLSIVEIYPDAPVCSPIETTAICSDYVKLQNVSAASIDLSAFRVRTGSYGQAASGSNTAILSGMLEPGAFTAFPISLNQSGSWVWLEDKYGTVRYDATLVGYPSNSGYDQQAWSKDANGNWRWTIYPTPTNQANQFAPDVAVNECNGLKISEIAANVDTEDQFIELYNSTDATIDISGCALQTNRSTSASHVFGPSTLGSGERATIYVKDTALTLTKTTSGTVYVLSSDLLHEVDAVAYDTLAEATSWSIIDGTWLQTYAVTAGSVNAWLEYAACVDGYIRNAETGNCNKVDSTSGELADCGEGKYRSPETNRCRNLESSTALAPCDEDQYRSPETNRCRSLATTASLLTPCAAGQERNPETNRCRSVATASQLQPCPAGQERNPETNRCRTKASSVAADFPVEAVAQSGEATLGWWAFGGVGILAAGYAGWEWRREVQSAIKKAFEFVSGGR